MIWPWEINQLEIRIQKMTQQMEALNAQVVAIQQNVAGIGAAITAEVERATAALTALQTVIASGGESADIQAAADALAAQNTVLVQKLAELEAAFPISVAPAPVA